MQKEINWKYNIGQRIIDCNEDDTIKRDLIVIDRKIVKKQIKDKRKKNGYTNNNYKYYKYKCNICGFDCGEHWSTLDKKHKDELWIHENHLSNGVGCACCCSNPQVVVKGINDIATTHPHLIKYFVEVEDSHTHTYSSKDKILIKCIDCGFEKETTVCNLYSYGVSCDRCGDGISYPEKIINNLFSQLNLIFIAQYSKTNVKWCKNYKYDFYFRYNNEDYIIEAHGLQHYKKQTNLKLTLEQNIKNDKNKYELAIQNGIKENNYIIIDCRKSDLIYIKNNILNSRLNNIFDLNSVDWIKVGQNSEKNLVKEICYYWKLHNETLTTKDLSKTFKLNDGTIRNYLKKGTKLGWCYYNATEEQNKNIQRASFKIEMFKDNKSLGVFKSAKELERQSEELFGTKLFHNCIISVCKNEKNEYKGYSFKYSIE
ncbi:hypothetical protein [Clostridium beijerinckii]|uniref:hypothetical protein n=1 Tax=Clostridium beijerinckii TaxID=1520 RepID=UPI001570EA64|nr:hypothetical protein [Clostridium beijerinckii]NRU52509.1 ribosomal protein S27E [Clostridium beijerinckii]NYC69388.1 ribosomal protein S27E [Clostridium beijerinckii]NYC91710.1 ribosomal protein S27E [Clostridium beijerinckii]